jgi:hypothetical protein
VTSINGLRHDAYLAASGPLLKLFFSDCALSSALVISVNDRMDGTHQQHQGWRQSRLQGVVPPQHWPVHGEYPFLRGTVTALEPLGERMLATVDWHNGEEPQKMIFGTLSKVTQHGLADE